MEKFKRVMKKSIEDTLYYESENAVESVIKTVFETILNAERTEYLENCDEQNKANGYYKRMARSITKYFQLNVPRDRMSLFKPVFLEAINKQESQMQDLAFKLYTKGLTTRDISEVFEGIYEKKLSSSSVSNITKEFQLQREAWQKRPVGSEYYFIYVDALYIPIRRDTVEKEAFYIVIGLKPDLKREILGVYNIPTESSEGWREVLKDLKTRGLEKCLMVIADGLAGLEKVIKEELPGTKLQKCLVHKIRNILLKARTRDKAAISEDFKDVFQLEKHDYTLAEGAANLKIFIDKWKRKYPSILSRFNNKHYEHYFAYLDFPHQIQRMIYTTNWIERLNKGIRRTTNIRNSFPNPDSALNLICAFLIDFEERVYNYPISSFLVVKDDLDDMLGDCLRHN